VATGRLWHAPVRMLCKLAQSRKQRTQESSPLASADVAASRWRGLPIFRRGMMTGYLHALTVQSSSDSNSLRLLQLASSTEPSQCSSCPGCSRTQTSIWPRLSCSSSRFRTNSNRCPHCGLPQNTHSHSPPRTFVLREAGRCLTARRSEVVRKLSRRYFTRRHKLASVST